MLAGIFLVLAGTIYLSRMMSSYVKQGTDLVSKHRERLVYAEGLAKLWEPERQEREPEDVEPELVSTPSMPQI